VGDDDPRTVSERLWIPDNPDGSGWADVDWASAVRGSRYHYRHAEPLAEARALQPPCYRVVTRLESAELHAHENSYYVPREVLAGLSERAQRQLRFNPVFDTVEEAAQTEESYRNFAF